MKTIFSAVSALSLLTFTSSLAFAQPQNDPNETKPGETKPADTKIGEPKPQGAPTETKSLEPLPPPPLPEPQKAEGDKTAATPAAAGTPAPATAAAATTLELHPYLTIAGGLKGDNVIDKRGEDRDDRFVTYAVSRFGLIGRYGPHVMVQSELMASGGVGLHGTSAYEGQAALQVRQQLVRINYQPLMVEVGRIIDEASVDYVSAHVQDTLMQDQAVRDPLLFSGYNLGNGIRGTVELVPKLRLGLAINAGNPISTTSTLWVGGTYPPFERLYTQAYQSVNQGSNHFPDDTFHVVIVTPSVMYEHEIFDVKLALQGVDFSTNTTKGGDDHVRGYNVRGTGRLKFLNKMIVPFASMAYSRNDTLQTNALDKRSDDRYQAINVGGGIDANLARRHAGFEDAADGFGAQYQQVQFIIGDGVVTTQRYINVGGTYWLTPHVAFNARVAMWVLQQKGAEDFGERTATIGLRAVIP